MVILSPVVLLPTLTPCPVDFIFFISMLLILPVVCDCPVETNNPLCVPAVVPLHDNVSAKGPGGVVYISETIFSIFSSNVKCFLFTPMSLAEL